MDMNNKKVCVGNDVPDASRDIISNLHDAILQQILSFLDTKQAVQTCVLSKRWKYLWTNVPCLNFNLGRFAPDPMRISFINFMDQVLSRRCSSDIHKFSCCSKVALDTNRLRSLIDQALQCNVQIVEITYSNVVDLPNGNITWHPLQLPHLLFTSKSLQVLHLNSCDDGSICLPRTMSFISLKKLHLQSISFMYGRTNGELIFACPNLRYLTLNDCCFGDLQSVKITALKLSNLEILRPSGNGTFASPWKCNIIVSAPNLSSFKYDYHTPLMCSMGNPLNIDAVDINIYKFYKTKSKKYDAEMAHRLIAMLFEFQHAKSVTLSLRAVKLLSKVTDINGQHTFPFCNLKNLKVSFNDSSFLRGSNYILQNSPKAKTELIAPPTWYAWEKKASWC